MNNRFYYPSVVVVVGRVTCAPSSFPQANLVLFILHHLTVFYYSENCTEFFIVLVLLRHPMVFIIQNFRELQDLSFGGFQ